ncbi:MAG TPA: RNA polymerase sigma factor [Tepidisphaeraceae bacterium]|nr:RNA polymerase sigma factor [Tepidisphaeraceae bacterium]
MPPPSDPRSDDDLVAALNAGDASAFDALYYRYRDRVLRLAYRFTGNDADAHDVLQETFAYLHGKFPGFCLTASLSTFLFPAVRNLSLAARRKRDRFASDDAAVARLPGCAPDGAAAGEARADLAAAMSNLSPVHREAVLLRYVDDLTIEEIAAATGVPSGTVKSRLHHAIAALRDDPRARRYFEK